MCRPYRVILLMYGSHDMRHTGFRRLTVVNGTPEVRGVTGLHDQGNNKTKRNVYHLYNKIFFFFFFLGFFLSSQHE